MAMAAAGVCLIVLGLLEVSKGAVYKVGDSAGWTTIGNVDYKLWSATKTFQLGDTIVFEYNPQFHNVMQVIHSEYKACNASSPISTHTTGNDSLTIDTHGHHFFVCGVPGHCQSGQKVDINVLRSPSPSSGIPSPPLPAATVPSPSPSAAPPSLKLGCLPLTFLLFYLFYYPSA
ncbi:mavicyanin-like [Salvia miltiorrhiza]|uniref:mavicyanin-like n=1 Tax=Salvia miltiorrhiza TaxID=226208 RepID=UPI0025AC855C|nr:mavicyanin-like [Salvia miltiorrhiza]